MQGTPDCLLFQHAYATFVATLPALSYALTAQNQYEETDAEDATTLIEAAKAAGFHTIYLSNQGKLGLYSTPLVAMVIALPINPTAANMPSIRSPVVYC